MGQAVQPPGHSIRNFHATLKGYAKLCQYSIKCTSCDKNIDYSDEIILDQLIRGISDKEILADLLGENKSDMKLLEVVEYVARKELAKSEQSTVSSESANAVKTTSNTPKKNAICWACQGKSHGQNTIKTRRDLCPAWNNECEKCTSKAHYTKCCSKCSSCSKWGHINERSKKCQNNHSAKNKGEELDSILVSGMKTFPCIQLSDIKILRENEHHGHHLATVKCNKGKLVSPLSHKVYSKEHGWQTKSRFPS